MGAIFGGIGGLILMNVQAVIDVEAIVNRTLTLIWPQLRTPTFSQSASTPAYGSGI